MSLVCHRIHETIERLIPLKNVNKSLTTFSSFFLSKETWYDRLNRIRCYRDDDGFNLSPQTRHMVVPHINIAINSSAFKTMAEWYEMKYDRVSCKTECQSVGHVSPYSTSFLGI